MTTYPDVRITKRINEFKLNGYDISAYSFVRKNITVKDWPVDVIRLNHINQSYVKRIIPIIKGFNQIKTLEKNIDNSIFYYFGLDVAIIGFLLNRNQYIYEEADLTHTDTKNVILKYLFEFINKRIIKNSFWTIFTSEGFIDYHFKNKIKPSNISVIPNKLNIRNVYNRVKKRKITDINTLKIGFVGFIRYESIINFAKVFATSFPKMEFHFYGVIVPGTEISSLKNKCNIFFHGEFKSPEDLPAIYDSIDLLLATYDVNFDNVRCAEPNKLYEAIYYQTPIIVSKDTFLSKKVNNLDVGYCLDALNNMEIIAFIEKLKLDDINIKIENCLNVPLNYLVSDNTIFFNQIKAKFVLNK